MDNSKKVLSDNIQSMDRQSMLHTIYEKIWYSKKSIPDNNYEPISLARVFSVIPEKHYCRYNISSQEIFINNWKDWFWFIKRKLLTDSWADAYLDDQNDDTIRAILTLISEK